MAIPFGAWAQAGDRGGMWSKLRLTERFQARDTSSPDPVENGVTYQAVTDLDFTFSTETRTEQLSFDIGGEYRFADGPTTDGLEGDFTAPHLRLRYTQDTASASLAIALSATQADLADVSPLSVGDSTGAALPSDLSDLQDGGTRTQLGFDSRLTLWDDAPFGLILGLGVDDISYTDQPTGSGLKDRITARTDVTGRFDITRVLQARLRGYYTFTKTDGTPQADRYGITASTSLARPDGAYSAAVDWSDGDGGIISGLSFGRSFKLPRTDASFGLGLTKATDSAVFMTGAASFEHGFGADSAWGPVTLSAERDITLSGRSSEELVTSLALGGSYVLSPVANLRLNAKLGQAETVATGDTVTLSEVGLTLGYDFSDDWRGAANLQARQRDPADSAATQSTTIGLSVTRSFENLY